MKTILRCEDSLEGIFSGVYEGWAGHYDHDTIELCLEESPDMELFSRYIDVPTDRERAGKVERTIRQKMGWEVYEAVGRAALSYDLSKGTAIYRLIVTALSMERPGNVLEVLTDPGVMQVTRLARTVWNEAHHLMGFVRFEELENGVLLSIIRPKNQVLPAIAPHFAERLPQENWAIYDEGRALFAVHPKGKDWFLLRGERLNEAFAARLSSEEMELQTLWKDFCSSIMIHSRRNEELQRQLLPKRFRPYMTEFNKEIISEMPGL